MGNLLVNTRDQQFLLFEQFGIEKVFDSEAYGGYSKDDVLMILSEAEKMVVNDVFPTLKEGDEEGCHFKNGIVNVPKCFREPFKKYSEAGWINPMDSPDVGGQGLPHTAGYAVLELFSAANYAFMMYPGLTHGAANLINVYGNEQQKKKYMEKCFSGEWTGTMCLTEPGAGSDVGALKTTAKRLPDGKFLITGTKCFISAGDHDLTPNIIHPVLARIEGDPAGTKGISIFIVPKIRVNDDGSLGEPNDVKCGGIEHKMGIKASATATLNFGEDGKCIGELLGEERSGIKIMFQMMNEARLGVGMQGVAIGSAAFQHAVSYAKERIQGTPVWEMKNPAAKAVTIINHPDVRKKLMWMKSHVEGIRALAYFGAYCMDMSKISKTEVEKGNWEGYFELLTRVSLQELQKLQQAMSSGELNPRDAKMRLAREIISMYHSAGEARKAQDKFELVFSRRDIPDDIPEILVEAGEVWLPKFMSDHKLVKSTSEGKRMLEQGAIKVNGEKFGNENLGLEDGMVIQVGKRKFGKIRIG